MTTMEHEERYNLKGKSLDEFEDSVGQSNESQYYSHQI